MSIKKYLLTGLATIFPLGATIFIVWFLVKIFGNILAGVIRLIPFVSRMPDMVLTIMGFFLLILILIGIGATAQSLLGRWTFRLIETLFGRLPLIRGLYTPAKQLTDALLIDKKSLKRVVIVEYPRRGVYSIGFVTLEKEIPLKGEKKGFLVFVASTPNPTTGWLILVPESDIISTPLSVDEGIKLVISGGIVYADKLRLTTKA